MFKATNQGLVTWDSATASMTQITPRNPPNGWDTTIPGVDLASARLLESIAIARGSTTPAAQGHQKGVSKYGRHQEDLEYSDIWSMGFEMGSDRAVCGRNAESHQLPHCPSTETKTLSIDQYQKLWQPVHKLVSNCFHRYKLKLSIDACETSKLYADSTKPFGLCDCPVFAIGPVINFFSRDKIYPNAVYVLH